jgi:hypothetical protein
MIGEQVAGGATQRRDERHHTPRLWVGEGQGVGVQNVVIRRFEGAWEAVHIISHDGSAHMGKMKA